jgi:hypothetical protein
MRQLDYVAVGSLKSSSSMYTREMRGCSFDLTVQTRKKAIKQQQQQRDTVASFGLTAAVFHRPFEQRVLN